METAVAPTVVGRTAEMIAAVVAKAYPATSALTQEQCDLVEDSMRHDVFHSTLDWQTRAQLEKGALQAFRLNFKVTRARKA